MESALVLRDIRKSFGSTKAVDGIDLTVRRGALYGVIGRMSGRRCIG
jgi:ABC-2 type transport system ATP-binding protein